MSVPDDPLMLVVRLAVLRAWALVPVAASLGWVDMILRREWGPT